MTKGELFLNAWAAFAVRSAAPIDLNNMAVTVNVRVSGRGQGDLSSTLEASGACPNKLALVTFQAGRRSSRSGLARALHALSQAEIDSATFEVEEISKNCKIK